MNSIAGSLVSSSPLSFGEIHLLKRRPKNEEGTRWPQRLSHGTGITEFRYDPIGNSWLYKAQLLQTGQYNEGLKLSTNTTAVRTNITRCGFNPPTESETRFGTRPQHKDQKNCEARNRGPLQSDPYCCSRTLISSMTSIFLQ
jgi:hypothetical protein